MVVMHSSTVQHKKSCEVSRLPVDHDIFIDYGLIVNRLVFWVFFFGGGGIIHL